MITYNYSSISAFLQETESAPHKIGYSLESDYFTENWNDSKNWSEAVNWVQNGRDLEPLQLEKIQAEILNVKNEFQQTQINSVCGSLVNIGEYVNGNPENMLYYQIDETPRPSKIIELDLNMCIGCKVSNTDIMIAGKEILKAIYYLELSGYSLALNCMAHMKDKGKRVNTDFIFKIKVKNLGEPLNVNTFFSCVSTDFTRRLYFRFTERLLKGESKNFDEKGRGGIYTNTGDLSLSQVIREKTNYKEIVKKILSKQ